MGAPSFNMVQGLLTQVKLLLLFHDFIFHNFIFTNDKLS